MRQIQRYSADYLPGRGLWVRYTDHQQRVQELMYRVAELEAECNRLGQGQIMLANEVAELEAENQRLKAPVSDAEKLSFFNNDNMAIWQKVCDVEALLASRATAKEQDNGPPKVALEKLACLGNGPHQGNSDGNVIAVRALDAVRARLTPPQEPTLEERLHRIVSAEGVNVENKVAEIMHEITPAPEPEERKGVKDLLCARISGQNVCFDADGYDANIIEAYRRGRAEIGEKK